MSQPVKLSDHLILDARLVGEVAERSIGRQIEFWAGLGRAVEQLLDLEMVLTLKKRGGAKPLSACLADVDTAAGHKRVTEYLQTRPYPHYEAAPGKGIVRIDANGTRTEGRFVNRQFVPAQSHRKLDASAA
jgi:hypothetical protein